MQTIIAPKQETGSSIYDFKMGDIIYRTKAASIKPKQPFSFYSKIYPNETWTDNSYRDPMEFLDIKNNLIYVKGRKSLSRYRETAVHPLKLELFWNDWARVEPETCHPTLFPDHLLNPPQPGIQGLRLFKGKPIRSFQPGEIIIMVKPPSTIGGTICPSLSLPEIGHPDVYRKPMELVGIEDNIIHLKYKDKKMEDRESKADLKIYENHWELFDMPEGVEEMHDIAF